VPYDAFRKKSSDTQIQDREYLSRQNIGNSIQCIAITNQGNVILECVKRDVLFKMLGNYSKLELVRYELTYCVHVWL